MENEPVYPIRSFSDPGSESKKRVNSEAQESFESSHKRMKLGLPQAQMRNRKNNLLHQDAITTPDHVEEFEKGHLDLNAEDTHCLIKQPRIPSKQLKVSNYSENGRNCPQEGRNPLRIWEQMMRQHASVSSYNAHERKKHSKDAVLRRNIELAKKVQVDRFARLAAPSGLLKGLNPGIINHVRNQKQVYSIIQAVVKSEENRHQPSGTKLDDLVNRSISEDFVGEINNKKGYTSEIATKQLASQISSCLSNVESGSAISVNSLSFQAAHVAFQWLELVSQDVKGRLEALRCSKTRVHSVIKTELPSLISRESLSYLEKHESPTEAHAMRWITLFQQMNEALSEEENHLENWLSQVKKMQMNCEWGLSHISPCATTDRSGVTVEIEKNLCIRAAAASVNSFSLFCVQLQPC